MTVHEATTPVGIRWITVCHSCGATTSHTDPAAASRTTCPCQRGDTA